MYGNNIYVFERHSLMRNIFYCRRIFNMGDSIKDRRLKVVNLQRRRIPDVILHTKNVMIPVVKPVPFNQSCDISFLENRRQILKAQKYRNNPALLFSETPLHTLYKPLENSIKVNLNFVFPDTFHFFHYYILLYTILKKILLKSVFLYLKLKTAGKKNWPQGSQESKYKVYYF